MLYCPTLIKTCIQKLVKKHLSLEVFLAKTCKGGQGLEQSADGSSGITVSGTFQSSTDGAQWQSLEMDTAALG